MSSLHSGLKQSPSSFCQWLTSQDSPWGCRGKKFWERNPCIFLPLTISPSIPGTVLPSCCSQQKKGPTLSPTICSPTTWMHHFLPPETVYPRHLYCIVSTTYKCPLTPPLKNSNNKTHRILSWLHNLLQSYHFSISFLSKLFWSLACICCLHFFSFLFRKWTF